MFTCSEYPAICYHEPMLEKDFDTNSAARQNLRQLSIIRNIALGGQILALLFFSQFQDIGLPVTVLGLVLAFYAVVIVATWWRTFRYPAITPLEFFCHLLVDIAFFTALLFFSGGASNPFVSYYLVPISVAATTLPLRYTWLVTLLSLAAYSWLLANYLPIPALAPSHHHGEGNNLHILGMWCNFAVSAGLITYFVTRMAGTLKQQEEQLAQQREDQLLDEQVLAIGSLAAGTAHELGTPLNTMKILVDEMVAEKTASDEDLAILQQQLEQCRVTLKQLVATAEGNSGIQEKGSLRSYFDKLFERWLVLKPRVQANIRFAEGLADLPAGFHPTIAQSLTSLLNNAADVSPEKVEIEVGWDSAAVEMQIRDFGTGVTPQVQGNLGKPFNTSKPDGMGLGLFLTSATLKRYGGTVSIEPASGGGTVTRVVLPLKSRP
ncbi:MAG: ATP-binding protein [Porticoccaceae bacterium]